MFDWRRRSAHAGLPSSLSATCRAIAARLRSGQQDEREPPVDTDHPAPAVSQAVLLRLGAVAEITSLSPSTIYRYVARGAFPPPVRAGPRCSRWVAADVWRWIALHASRPELCLTAPLY